MFLHIGQIANIEPLARKACVTEVVFLYIRLMEGNNTTN